MDRQLIDRKAEEAYQSLTSGSEVNEYTIRSIALQMYMEGFKYAYEVAYKEAVEEEVDEITDVEFDKFWNLYDKKIGQQACRTIWKRIPKKDRRLIMEFIPLYKQCQPDKRYRKNPATFLRQRAWLDELIPSQYAERLQSSEQRATAAARLAEGLFNLSAEE